jgi:pseudoazurin
MTNRIKKIAILITVLFSVISLNSNSFAADATVEMLNKQGKESMVFSQKIVKINVGDKVFWKATNKGHNVEFIKGGVPEGVDKFKSKYNKDVEFKFDVPGIYAYWCTPHKSMGMIGFIIVGDDKSNLDNIKSIRYSGKSKKLVPDLINSL